MRTGKQIEESRERLITAADMEKTRHPPNSNGEAHDDAPDKAIAFLEGEITECVQYRAEGKIQLAQLQQQANQIVARQQQLDQKQAGYEAALKALRVKE